MIEPEGVIPSVREVIDAQGYIITPALMSHRIDDCGEIVYGPADPNGFPEGLEVIFLGRLEPIIRDPFTRHEAVFGRFFVYDPEVIDVKQADVVAVNGLTEDARGAIDSWVQGKVNEGKFALESDRRDGRKMVISRKQSEPKQV